MGLCGDLAGNLGTRVDFGRLGPSWSHVGAKLKHFGVESVILGVLKSKINSSSIVNRFSKNFEASDGG